MLIYHVGLVMPRPALAEMVYAIIDRRSDQLDIQEAIEILSASGKFTKATIAAHVDEAVYYSEVFNRKYVDTRNQGR